VSGVRSWQGFKRRWLSTPGSYVYDPVPVVAVGRDEPDGGGLNLVSLEAAATPVLTLVVATGGVSVLVEAVYAFCSAATTIRLRLSDELPPGIFPGGLTLALPGFQHFTAPVATGPLLTMLAAGEGKLVPLGLLLEANRVLSVCLDPAAAADCALTLLVRESGP